MVILRGDVCDEGTIAVENSDDSLKKIADLKESFKNFEEILEWEVKKPFKKPWRPGILGLFCGVVSYETFLTGSTHFSTFS